ncbi:Multidrug and toxin extrusion protein 1 [Liparis tanakae]|uniref:Multidrug and toxin extrusion protein n=1 Tax=Liparis tanakae TaxID=230148 RepID=A0A4Z2HDV1_9TELE|nr:Multidrug and toxin extrusion protein 1 [Liparis tanakae]
MEKLGSPDPAGSSPPGAGLADDGAPVATAANDEGAVSSKLFRCACVRRWLPLAYREELYHVVLLTWPLMINVTTTATGYGLSLACDTLISQTFGSGNMKRVGVILQRSSLILLLFCLPCWGLLINTQNLLLIMHQEHEVARIAHLYVMAFLPAVPAMFLHHLQVAYLQNQGIILPQLYTAAAANVVNLGVNYVLIHTLEMGVIGSAIANSLCQITICLLLYGYIRWKKLHLPTWGGWSTACLQDWGSYMKLAIPSIFMVCFEWWVWEIGGFLAAACVRVGNALGAGNTTRAIITCKVALVLSGVLAVFQGIVLVGCKSVVGHIFTSDENIVEIVSDSLTVYTFLQFFDAILCVCSGILVGAGMQKIAALSNLVCYYCVGLPVGIALMFAAKLRILVQAPAAALAQFPVSRCRPGRSQFPVSRCRAGRSQFPVSRCHPGRSQFPVSRCHPGRSQFPVSRCRAGRSQFPVSRCRLGRSQFPVSRCRPGFPVPRRRPSSLQFTVSRFAVLCCRPGRFQLPLSSFPLSRFRSLMSRHRFCRFWFPVGSGSLCPVAIPSGSSLWIGILTCVFFETGFFLFLIFKLNWKKVSYKAQLRAGKKMVVMPERPGRTLLSEAMISDFPDTLDGKEAPKTGGYSPVNSQDQELKEGHEANTTNTGRAEAEAESVAFHIAFPVPEASIQSSFNLTQNWTNDSSLTTLAPQDLTLKL